MSVLLAAGLFCAGTVVGLIAFACLRIAARADAADERLARRIDQITRRRA